jgi:pseudaminic acid biosynthesis-associated methylase
MSSQYNSEQEQFWAQTYAKDYISKNSSFDQKLGVEAWQTMLRRAEGVGSLLECGCNIGRNLQFLDVALPTASKSVIEISKPAFEFVSRAHRLSQAFNGAILDSNFAPRSFDLVYTIGVLIHINPDQLLDHMAKMHDYSRRYVLMGEYFNRTPMMIEYQGERDRLFKRDFGKLFIENFPVKLVDYGFLWGHLYDVAGFDDITWWLFEKQ